ncbi:hypothetical protein PISMIDRAFT_10351 [Pisolithus microcarpus 441]|uniref:Uncharacterized protein n=1 Tax=Pisolithus microcarpus 441 TaxID=765257 RepID=A0A0C9YGX4_9AGAM|nr:hypothetical protein PISMIDRAFT_10351 [Pisolithus microcarpus 441]
MPSHSKKADLDHCLAQWHLKLEKVYKNDCDEGLTYVRLLGVIPLTPAMIDNWCITLEDGQAMINVLLNIPSFDLANKAPVLHPTHKAAAHLPSPSVDVNSLTSVLLLQTLTQSSLLTSQQPLFHHHPSLHHLKAKCAFALQASQDGWLNCTMR